MLFYNSKMSRTSSRANSIFTKRTTYYQEGHLRKRKSKQRQILENSTKHTTKFDINLSELTSICHWHHKNHANAKGQRLLSSRKAM